MDVPSEEEMAEPLEVPWTNRRLRSTSEHIQKCQARLFTRFCPPAPFAFFVEAMGAIYQCATGVLAELQSNDRFFVFPEAIYMPTAPSFIGVAVGQLARRNAKAQSLNVTAYTHLWAAVRDAFQYANGSQNPARLRGGRPQWWPVDVPWEKEVHHRNGSMATIA